MDAPDSGEPQEELGVGTARTAAEIKDVGRLAHTVHGRVGQPITTAKLGLIPGILYGPQTLPGVIPSAKLGELNVIRFSHKEKKVGDPPPPKKKNKTVKLLSVPTSSFGLSPPFALP